MRIKCHWQYTANEEYTSALLKMSSLAESISQGVIEPQIWQLQHYPVYTYGPSFKDMLVLKGLSAPCVKVSRGGLLSFHGLGQAIVYPLLPLKCFFNSVHTYISFLETVLISVCQNCHVEAFCIQGQRGVFTRKGKIASVGIHVCKGVTTHGISLNVSQTKDGEYFKQIQPCGLETKATYLDQEGVDLKLIDAHKMIKLIWNQQYKKQMKG